MYRAPFILTLFAIHLNNIVGAQDIPSLKLTPWETSIVARYPPRGVLALAIAAVRDSFLLKFSPGPPKSANFSQVERTLHLWVDGDMKPINIEQATKMPLNKPTTTASDKFNPQTGAMSNRTTQFSADNWGEAMGNNVRSINKMREELLKEIVVLAASLMSWVKTCHQATSPGPSSIPEVEDFCALLKDEWCITVFLSCLIPLMALGFLDTPFPLPCRQTCSLSILFILLVPQITACTCTT